MLRPLLACQALATPTDVLRTLMPLAIVAAAAKVMVAPPKPTYETPRTVAASPIADGLLLAAAGLLASIAYEQA